MHLRFTHTSILLAVCALGATLSFLGFVLHAQAQSEVNHNSIGNLDTVSCDVIAGWTCDADNFDTSLDVHLYKDGTYTSGSWLMSTTAREVRSDVRTVCGNKVQHGFIIPTPAALKDGAPHTISVYGISTGASGNNTLLGTQTLTCAPSPTAGVCGTAAKAYTTADASLSGSYCTTRISPSTNPAFSSGSGSVTWTCPGENGGTAAQCEATRSSVSGGGATTPPTTPTSPTSGIAGVCGTAAKAYTTAVAPLSGTFCTTRISPSTNPAFLPGPGRVTWICPGENGGSNATCEATRSDVLGGASGTCGPYADVTVTGSTGGIVWGSGPYGERSDFGSAAVHAGLIQPGQTAAIRRILVGPSTLASSERNGVTASAYAQSMCAVTISLASAATGGAQYSCTGTLPSNATTYTGDETGLAGNTARAFNVVGTAAKCEFSCNSGYYWSGSICSPVGAVGSPSAACTETKPANATAFPADANGLGGVPWSYQTGDTARRCEFKCSSGYDWNGTACRLSNNGPVNPTAQCLGALPQNAVANPSDANGIGGVAWLIQPNDTARKCEFSCMAGFQYDLMKGCVVPERITSQTTSRWTYTMPTIELTAADPNPIGATTLSWRSVNASTTRGCRLFVMELYGQGPREIGAVDKDSVTAYPQGYPTIPIVVPTNYTLRCSTGTQAGDVWLYPKVRSYASVIPATQQVGQNSAFKVVLDSEFADKCYYTQKRDGVALKSNVQIISGSEGWTEEILARTSDNTPTRRRFTYDMPQGVALNDGASDAYEWSFSCTPTWGMNASTANGGRIQTPSSPEQVRMTVGQQAPTAAIDGGLIPAAACTLRLSFSNMVSGFVDVVMSPWR